VAKNDHLARIVGILGLLVAIFSMVLAYQANQKSERANTIAGDANSIARESNAIAQESNKMAIQTLSSEVFIAEVDGGSKVQGILCYSQGLVHLDSSAGMLLVNSGEKPVLLEKVMVALGNETALSLFSEFRAIEGKYMPIPGSKEVYAYDEKDILGAISDTYPVLDNMMIFSYDKAIDLPLEILPDTGKRIHLKAFCTECYDKVSTLLGTDPRSLELAPPEIAPAKFNEELSGYYVLWVFKFDSGQVLAYARKATASVAVYRDCK
jgi:hypothetical protein